MAQLPITVFLGTKVRSEVSNTEAEENMNRKSLLLVGALFLLVAIRYALAQDDTAIGNWEPDAVNLADDPAEWIFSVMMLAPLLGAVIGGIRVLSQRSARPVVQPICLR